MTSGYYGGSGVEGVTARTVYPNRLYTVHTATASSEEKLAAWRENLLSRYDPRGYGPHRASEIIDNGDGTFTQTVTHARSCD